MAQTVLPLKSLPKPRLNDGQMRKNNVLTTTLLSYMELFTSLQM